MSNYKDLTHKVTSGSISTEIATINAALDIKIAEVDAKLANLPDVDAVAQQKAVAMALVLG